VPVGNPASAALARWTKSVAESRCGSSGSAAPVRPKTQHFARGRDEPGLAGGSTRSPAFPRHTVRPAPSGSRRHRPVAGNRVAELDDGVFLAERDIRARGRWPGRSHRRYEHPPGRRTRDPPGEVPQHGHAISLRTGSCRCHRSR
jgi:hypothetical protein